MYLFTEGKPDPFPMSFCYIRTFSYPHILCQLSYTNADGKENTEEEGEVKVMYILLSGTLAVVVTSAAVEAL